MRSMPYALTNASLYYESANSKPLSKLYDRTSYTFSSMAPMISSLKATARPCTAISAPTRSCFGPVPRFQRARMVVVQATEPSEPPTADASPKDFDIPRTGRDAPMSETKRAGTTEQGAAPEGDKAIVGQKWQLKEGDAKTPEERFGSAEAAAEAKEASKDRTRTSELQTNDDTANAPGGGMTGEGSSA
eukprot:GHRQ01006812.1.p1 GENE.GHRQ01006812.1~~GHRQ01006812.1.p1  ORF type:complete len:189 (-),score=33.90 GHRQ01006812.1:485-1051(-)